MMFSTKAEYGVRVMVELARSAGDEPVPLAEIADRDGLPLAYLEHLVARLRKAGLVDSRRGSHGGYLLARPAAEITMAEVVEALEGSIAPIECISEAARRHDRLLARVRAPTHVCPTKLLWTRVRMSIVRDAARDDAGRPARDAGDRPAGVPTATDRAAERRSLGGPWPNSRSATCTCAPRSARSCAASTSNRPRRDPRPDGPQRLGQVDARQHDHGPPRLRDHRGRDHLQGRGHHRGRARTSAPRRACSWPSSTRSRSPGVSVANFLRMAINAKREEPIQVKEFRDPAAARHRAARRRPLVHLAPPQRRLLRRREEARRGPADGDAAPDIAILDETDSGLDIDALRTVAEGVAEAARRAGPRRPDHHPLPAHPALRPAASSCTS